MGRFANLVQHAFRSMSYMPMAFITAKTGKNVKALLNLSQSLFKQSQKRVEHRHAQPRRSARPSRPTRRPPARTARRGSTTPPRSSVAPPTIVLFVNSTRLFDATYQRYLLNVFREKLPFHDIPIKLYMRSRKQEEPGSRSPRPVRAGEDDPDDSGEDFGPSSSPSGSTPPRPVRPLGAIPPSRGQRAPGRPRRLTARRRRIRARPGAPGRSMMDLASIGMPVAAVS